MVRKTGTANESLRCEVGDVAEVAGTYARLGLRILRRTEKRAVVELPCGIHLVLSRSSAHRVAAR